MTFTTCSSITAATCSSAATTSGRNMLGGTELIRRKLGKDAHAMTITLLLNSEGKKMGKTAKGAVWLDPNKTTSLRVLPVLGAYVGDADVHEVHCAC